MNQPTAEEQYLLELVNRARQNPTAEAQLYGISLNQDLSPGTISETPKQPLAFNLNLIAAAREHSQWMLDTDTFAHTGAGGSSAGERMEASGYNFTGSWTWGENIAWRGTTGTPDVPQFVAKQHEGLFLSPGHRTNILKDNFREIGIGILLGDYQSYQAVMTSQNFAKSGSDIFLTGVAFADTVVKDDFYSVGEGIGGIEVRAVRQSDQQVLTTTTMSAGGYQIALTPGTYEVTFAGEPLGREITQTIVIDQQNVKLDVEKEEDNNALNSAPVIEQIPSGVTVEQIASSGDLVGKVTATDVDGDNLSFAFTQESLAAMDLDGDGIAALEIANQTNEGTKYTAEVLVNDSDDLTALPNQSLNLQLTVTDGQEIVPATLNIFVINQSPTIEVTLASEPLLEGSSVETVVATVTTTDPENDPLNFSLSKGNTDVDRDGIPAFRLEPNGNTLQIRVQDSDDLDWEQQPTFDLTVSADEPFNASVTEIVTINLVSTQQPPVFVNEPFSFEIEENSSVGQLVGKVTAVDPNSDHLTWNLIDGNVDADGNGILPFAINGQGEIIVSDEGELIRGITFNLSVSVSDGIVSTLVPITTNVTIEVVPEKVKAQAPVQLYLGTAADDEMNLANSSTDRVIFTGNGNDQIQTNETSETPDRLYAGTGDDGIDVLGSRKRVFGGRGSDRLDSSKGAGQNRLFGGDGSDTLTGGRQDVLIGGQNDDTLHAGEENNVLSGGEGADTFVFANGEGGKIPRNHTLLDFEVDKDRIDLTKLIVNNQSVTFDTLSFKVGDGGTELAIKGLNSESPLAVFWHLGIEAVNNPENFLFS